MSEELKIEATIENWRDVCAFLEDFMEQHEVPMKSMMQITMAVEELYVNIASYAYAPKKGMAEIQVEYCSDPKAVTVTLSDQGKPFDPVSRRDPDTSLPADAREVGGLGILMVRKSMDEFRYVYRDGSNITTITKKLKGQ